MEGRRPYYSPHRDIHPQEIIYAQPVTIKPVGAPLPAIPVRKPVGYGPPKPVPIPPSFGSGPPHIHSGPPGPIYTGSRPPFPRPVPSFPGPYPAYKKPPHHLSTKPIYEEDGEYDFIPEDKHEFLEKKQVIVQPSSGVQQHVHHHYHHGDDAHKPSSVITGTPGLAGPILGPGPIGGNGLGNYGYGSSGTYGQNYNDFEEYKKAFKIKAPSGSNSLDPITVTESYANKFPAYEKPKRDSFFSGKGFSNQESGKVLNSGFGGSNFGSNNFGSNNFGSNNFGSSNNNFGSGNSGFGSNGFDNGFSSSNYEDCVCVPYDQCAAIDQAGRKDDLFLPIDPRNVGKNIDAETEEVVITDENGGMSVIRVPKGVNATEQAEQSKEDSKTEEKKDEETKREKREAKPEAKKDGPTSKSSEAQGVS